MKKILVTGVTGFLASHITIQLLEKGYEVIGTLRDDKRMDSIKNVIQKHTSNIQNLSFKKVDLMDELTHWISVSEGVDTIIHVASPFPTTVPKNETEVILPAKQGVVNVLKAATENKIRKVVYTSSTGASVYGKRKKGIFSEEDWTDETNYKDTTPYFRSKTIAEKVAWDYVKTIDNAPEFTSILPGLILGPVLEADYGNSANAVKKLLDGSVPAIPKIGYEIVDVRSAAELHIKAMESEVATGERFIAANGFLWFADIAKILKEQYPERKIPSKQLPDFLVKIFSYIDKETKPILVDLGAQRKINYSKAVELLEWQPIPVSNAVKDCAYSLIKNNVL